MSKLEEVHGRGLAADRPLSADVGPGTLYFSTDTLVLERNNETMTAWETYSGTGSTSVNKLFAWTVNDGTAALVVGPYLISPSNGNLTKGKYIVKAKGAASLVFDILKNGVSILGAPVTVTTAVALGAVQTFSLAVNPTPVALDDVFVLKINTGTSAWQFQVQVES